MEEYFFKLKSALGVIQARYNEKMNELHIIGNYGVKGMFADKYAIAYTAMIDDEAEGLTPVINASVYDKKGKLFNQDFTKAEFLTLYREVKSIVKEIEKKYQIYLAELGNQPSEERLNYIIEHNEF